MVLLVGYDFLCDIAVEVAIIFEQVVSHLCAQFGVDLRYKHRAFAKSVEKPFSHSAFAVVEGVVPPKAE